jgi:predicted component of type VI protein secretion system
MATKPRKEKSPLQKVPTRKLVASIKRDLRKMLKERDKQQKEKD